MVAFSYVYMSTKSQKQLRVSPDLILERIFSPYCRILTIQYLPEVYTEDLFNETLLSFVSLTIKLCVLGYPKNFTSGSNRNLRQNFIQNLWMSMQKNLKKDLKECGIVEDFKILCLKLKTKSASLEEVKFFFNERFLSLVSFKTKEYNEQYERICYDIFRAFCLRKTLSFDIVPGKKIESRKEENNETEESPSEEENSSTSMSE
jgi:hypothetical protein